MAENEDLDMGLFNNVKDFEPSETGLTTLTSEIKTFSCKAFNSRKGESYEGQTIFHVAICKENVELIKAIVYCWEEQMKKEKESGKKFPTESFLSLEATGSKFKKSAMLGGLPLIVAALTLKPGLTFACELIWISRVIPVVFLVVLEAGKEFYKNENDCRKWFMQTNSKQDNFFHSLITYSHLYPDKSKEAATMFQYVIKMVEENIGEKYLHTMLKEKNGKGKTPLLLAAYLGQEAIFKLIIELKLYCFRDSQDAQLDIKKYDISEIDTATADDLVKQAPLLCILHDLEPSIASSLVSSGPIGRVITKKWSRYRVFFYIWLVIHFTYVGILTWYAVERSARDATLQDSLNVSCPRPISGHGLSSSYHFVGLVIALGYIVMEVSRTVKSLSRLCGSNGVSKRSMFASGFTKWFLTSVLHPYGNGFFRISFFLMAMCLIADVVLVYSVDCYDNYMLLCAVVLGWFLFLFFMRCWRRFSFFTLLIQQIALNEMLSFFVILAIQVAAFGTALYMAIQGSQIAEDEEYSTYWRTLFSMARLVVGNGEINNLYSTKYPALTISIFIAFVIMTILLMLNALIAVLSGTVSELTTDSDGKKPRYRHFLLQRLSIILYIESFIPSRFYRSVGKIETDHRRTIKMKSLREPGSTDNDAQADEVEPGGNGKEEENEEKTQGNPTETNRLNNSLISFFPGKHANCQLDIYNMHPETKTNLTPVYVSPK